MIDQNNPLMTSLTDKPPQSSGFGSFVVKAIWIVSISTLLIFLIFLSSGHTRLSQSGLSIVVSLVYTALIALPSIFLLTRVSIRYTARFPRLVILMQALLLICTATAGTLAGALRPRSRGHCPRWRVLVRSSRNLSPSASSSPSSSVSASRPLRPCATSSRPHARTAHPPGGTGARLQAAGRGAALFARIAHPSAFSLQHAQLHCRAHPHRSRSARKIWSASWLRYFASHSTRNTAASFRSARN